MKIVLGEVTVETVKKGQRSWSAAEVSYTYNGETRTKKLMSFSNPEVFAKVVETAKGTELEVTLTKDAQGYSQWAKVEVAGSAPRSATVTAAPTRSTYETSEERAIKQLYIVRQSSITNAIALLSVGAKVAPDTENVLDVAQAFVDFVYDNAQETLATASGNSESVSEQ